MSAEQRDLELVYGYCLGSLIDADFLELEDRLSECSQLRQLQAEYRSIETALPFQRDSTGCVQYGCKGRRHPATAN
jgi:hypothetical protein